MITFRAQEDKAKTNPIATSPARRKESEAEKDAGRFLAVQKLPERIAPAVDGLDDLEIGFERSICGIFR